MIELLKKERENLLSIKGEMLNKIESHKKEVEKLSVSVQLIEKSIDSLTLSINSCSDATPIPIVIAPSAPSVPLIQSIVEETIEAEENKATPLVSETSPTNKTTEIPCLPLTTDTVITLLKEMNEDVTKSPKAIFDGMDALKYQVVLKALEASTKKSMHEIRQFLANNF